MVEEEARKLDGERCSKKQEVTDGVNAATIRKSENWNLPGN